MDWKNCSIDRIPQLPAMLGGEERQFLYWVAKECYTGRGEIMDIGAFLGGSAAALGQGLRNNLRDINKARRVHSFDFFAFAEFCRPYAPEFRGDIGDDTLPIFVERTRAFSDLIAPVKGDICKQRWEQPIEVLFLDFTQTWMQHDAVADIFYRRLMPGGVLIHQDYLYVICYWLHIFMEYYADYFELVSPHIYNTSAAWRLKRSLPEQALADPLYRRHSVSDLMALLDRSIQRYDKLSGEPFSTELRCARTRFILHAEGPDAAFRYARNLNPTESVEVVVKEILHWNPANSPYRDVFRS